MAANSNLRPGIGPGREISDPFGIQLYLKSRRRDIAYVIRISLVFFLPTRGRAYSCIGSGCTLYLETAASVCRVRCV